MRVVIQRVKNAAVEIRNKNHSSVGQGLLIFLGIENDDGEDDISWLCKKIIQLRIFDDKDGVMNFSVADIDGEILVISQFTLHAKTKKGNRPSYIKAARLDVAIPLYEKFVEKLGFYLEKEIKTGEFGALMQVSLIN
ncbi:D-aminoacyl-tRNA deacylase [subsurface metagenome]